MLEFAYTGEVNVAQELLPSLLHTARSFKIKGLDKVESPVESAAPPAAHQQQPPPHHWAPEQQQQSSAPPTRSHSPSSMHSQQDIKPPPTFGSEHFLDNKPPVRQVHPQAPITGVRREREVSPPNSRPPTREASPNPQANSARTPPPKRWKRSFDMTQPSHMTGHKDNEEHLPMVTRSCGV